MFNKLNQDPLSEIEYMLKQVLKADAQNIISYEAEVAHR